jgi:voltage-gated potassium channel
VNLPINLRAGVVALTVVIIIGTMGFMVTGDLGVGDSLYLTMVTITTLGLAFLSEPLTGPEKFWLVLVLLAGMGAALYTLTAFVEYGFETLIGSDHRKRRKMTKQIDNLSHHVIICGYGRVGATASDTLVRNRIPVVVIESDPLAVQRAVEDGVPVVDGDATRDEVLIEAGVERARSVIASVASSSDNLVITLSCKAIRPDLPVTARAIDHQTEKKLALAGADAVVTPELVGGHRMAALATQPGLAEFIETVVRDSAYEFRIERFIVGTESPVVGRSLGQLDLRNDSGAMVIGIAGEGEPLRANPDPTKPFRVGDAVFGLGTENQLDRLRVMLEG